MAVPWSHWRCHRLWSEGWSCSPCRGRAVKHGGRLRRGWNAAVTAQGDTQEAGRDQRNVYFHEHVCQAHIHIFTPLLPFEGTSRHPQLCQGWVPELSMAVPPARTSVQSSCLGTSREAPTAAVTTCHLPVPWQGCDTCQHHVLPLHLLNHSSCCLPGPQAHPPHLFL